MNQSCFTPSKGLADFQDSDFQFDISNFGQLLRAHSNYCMVKFLLAFEKTNVKMIVKTSSLINNIISFSRDTLKQNKGLEMLSSEKSLLRQDFNENKHHLVSAMNIILYL